MNAEAPDAGVNVPVSVAPRACAGRNPGWSPKSVSNAVIKSWLNAIIFSSVGNGIVNLLRERIADVNTAKR